jgi:hypothetical protein
MLKLDVILGCGSILESDRLAIQNRADREALKHGN